MAQPSKIVSEPSKLLLIGDIHTNTTKHDDDRCVYKHEQWLGFIRSEPSQTTSHGLVMCLMRASKSFEYLFFPLLLFVSHVMALANVNDSAALKGSSSLAGPGNQAASMR